MKNYKEFYLNEVICEMDNLPCCHPASVNIDVANTYYSLAKMLRPLLIVEIGCFIGFSTQHFAQAIKELGFGTILSIDAFDWEVDAGRGVQNRQEVAEYYREKANIADIVTFIKGYSDQVYSTIKEDIKNKIDLLYIDGDHSVQGVFNDFNIYYSDVREGGYIILHDIYPEMCGVDGPRVLLDTLKQSDCVPKHIELLEMQTKDGFGIALLRKTSNKPIQLSPFNHLENNPINLLLSKFKKHQDFDKNDGDYQVTFEVVDKDSKQPLAGVKFICPQRCDEERITLDDGIIQMPHFKPNRYIINFYAENYESVENTLFDIPYGQHKHFFKIEMQRIQ